MNDYPDRIMQEAYRLLCTDLNKMKTLFESDTGVCIKKWFWKTP